MVEQELPTAEAVAVRGERLALMSIGATDADPLQEPSLVLFETNAEGRVIRQSRFDDEELSAALEELDNSFCAGEGAESAYVVRLVEAMVRAPERRAWAALERLFSVDVRATDHRALGFPLSDRASVVAMQRSLIEIAPDAFRVLRTLEVRAAAALMFMETRGTSADGSEYLWELVAVARSVAGEFVEAELFDPDQYDVARARFEEWGSEVRTPDIDNPVVRTLRSWGWINEVRGARAWVDTVADDMVSVVNDVMSDTRFEPVAVRGDRLALIREHASSAGGVEVAHLALYEVDDSGRVCRRVSFDESNVVAAVEALEARYRELRGDAYSTIERDTAGLGSAFNAREWATIEALVSPQAVWVDHAPLGFGTNDREQFIATGLRALTELAPDVVGVGTKSYADGRVLLSTVDAAGTTPEGNEYSWFYIYLLRGGSDGLIERIETFNLDQWDEALATFDEWTSESLTPSLSGIDNAVTRSVRAALALSRDGAIDSAGEKYTAHDIERIDRRRGVSAPYVRGRDAFNDSVHAIFEVFGSITAEPVAVRGERLALMRVRFAKEDGFEQLMLTLYEADDAGKQARLVTFDEDDLVSALDELEDRYCAGEGAANEYAVRRNGDSVRSHAKRDWVAFEQLFAPGLRAVDHRIMGFPLADRTSFMAMQQSLAEVTHDAVLVFRTIEVAGDAVGGRTEVRGTTPDGNQYAWEFLMMSRSIGGEVVELELFASEEHEAAWARFAEWAIDTPTPEVDNDVVRTLRRAVWLTEFDDPAAARQHIAEDVEAFDEYRFEPLAVRGERLALVRVRVSSPTGSEITRLSVHEADASRRLRRSVTFDEGDIIAALEELATRNRVILGDAYGALDRHGVDTNEALQQRDWTRFEATFAPDFVAVDHRPLGFPPADRNAFVHERMRSAAEMMPDHVVIGAKHYSRGMCMLSNTIARGTTPEGNAYLWTFYQVWRLTSDGVWGRLEIFPDDQWSEAVALFDGWTRQF